MVISLSLASPRRTNNLLDLDGMEFCNISQNLDASDEFRDETKALFSQYLGHKSPSAPILTKNITNDVNSTIGIWALDVQTRFSKSSRLALLHEIIVYVRAQRKEQIYEIRRERPSAEDSLELRLGTSGVGMNLAFLEEVVCFIANFDILISE
jgi:hypothetical protein